MMRSFVGRSPASAARARDPRRPNRDKSASWVAPKPASMSLRRETVIVQLLLRNISIENKERVTNEVRTRSNPRFAWIRSGLVHRKDAIDDELDIFLAR